MQTQREKWLAMALLMAIFVAGGGFLGYLFLYMPIKERNDTIRQLEADLDDRSIRLLQIEQDMPRLEKQMKRSLPADVDMSRREYEIKLNQLLRDSEFVATSIIIDPRPADVTTSPVLAKNKPIYTRLTFVVQVRGELLNLLDFMTGFYKMDLLHQIKKISVQQLTTTRAGEKSNQLDISLTIEALVLDNAEKRPTLLASNSPGPSIRVLAEPDRDYGSIAGRDVFYGPPPPPPPPPPATRVEEKPEVDLTPFIRLTSVTLEQAPSSESFLKAQILGGGLALMIPPPAPQGKAEVTDAYSQQDFVLEQRAGGATNVESYYYLNGRKRTLDKGKLLVVGEEGAKNRLYYRILRIEPGEVILQKIDVKNGKTGQGTVAGGMAMYQFMEPVYAWHIGDLLKDLKRLTAQEAQKYGKQARSLDGIPAPPRRPGMFGGR